MTTARSGKRADPASGFAPRHRVKRAGFRKKKRLTGDRAAVAYLTLVSGAAAFVLWAGWQFGSVKDNHAAWLEGPGLVPWHRLANISFMDRNDAQTIHFDNSIVALDEKMANLRGFITPLASSPDQRHFILSSRPPSCPYCLPAGPEGMVEIYCSKPVGYSTDPVTLSGKFELLRADASGFYYRMVDAEAVSPGT